MTDVEVMLISGLITLVGVIIGAALADRWLRR
jgi:hypothetical protein